MQISPGQSSEAQTGEAAPNQAGSQASLADRRAHVVYSDLPLGFAAWPGSIQWLLPWALCVIGLNKLASSWAILQDRYLQGGRGLPRKNSTLSQPRLLGVDEGTPFTRLYRQS